MKEAGLQESSRDVGTPVERSNKLGKEVQSLEPRVATRYRGVVARLNYLGQDRSEIQFAVKGLGKEMSNPRQSSWTMMKRGLRYLKGAPRAVLHMPYQ